AYLFVVVWSGDIFAYYVGRSIGKTPFAPRVSPKKTWEGAIASFVGSVLLGSWMLMHRETLSYWSRMPQLTNLFDLPPGPVAAVVLSAAVNVAAQVGDLAESVIKRGADIKDSGTI